jgi:hypothetical protein
MKKRVQIAEAEFRRLWAAGASRQDLAERYRCSVSWIDNYRMELALPARNRANPQECYSENDPTPEEIAERARELREKHFAERRLETDVASRSRAWRGAVA